MSSGSPAEVSVLHNVEDQLPGDARRGPVRAARGLRAVSTIIEGPQGSWAVWWWWSPSGSWALA